MRGVDGRGRAWTGVGQGVPREVALVDARMGGIDWEKGGCVGGWVGWQEGSWVSGWVVGVGERGQGTKGLQRNVGNTGGRQDKAAKEG